METTEVKVFPIQEEKLKAFVSIVFDHCFMINDIKIIQGRDGLFISMPSRKKKNGEFKDVAHPLNNETRRMIEDRVLAEYDRVLEERGEPPADRGERAAVRPRPAAVEAEERSLAAAPEKSLEEVEEMHLRDSFWSV
jgi:stage V sporulation protein G